MVNLKSRHTIHRQLQNRPYQKYVFHLLQPYGVLGEGLDACTFIVTCRDIQPSNGFQSATPAPPSTARPSTRSASQQPTENLTPAQDDVTPTQAPENVSVLVPAVDTAVPEESASAAIDETDAAESVKQSPNVDAETSDKVEVENEKDSGAGAEEKKGEEAAQVAETERVVYTRRAKQPTASQVRSEEKSEEKGSRKRKGKRGAEEAVADGQEGSAKEVAPADVMEPAVDVAETPLEDKELCAGDSGSARRGKGKLGSDEVDVAEEEGPVGSTEEPVDGENVPADVSRTPSAGKDSPADVSQALPDQQDVQPPGEPPLVKAAVEHAGPREGLELAAETAKEPEAEMGIKRRGRKGAANSMATEIGGAEVKQTANETVLAGGRMTRRRAKELGVDFEALPSGLVDGSEVKAGGRGRKARKNRRKELDEGAIRQQTLKKELEAAGKTEGAQVEATAEGEEPAEVRETGTGGGSTPAKLNGGDAEKSVVDEKVAVEQKTAEKVDSATVPETPPEGPPVRRSQREKRANGEAPAGRVTRGRAAKGEPVADVMEGETGAEVAATETPEAVADTEKGVPKEEFAELLVNVATPIAQEEGEGTSANVPEAAPDSEGETLAVKKKGGKKKGKGKQKKTPPLQRASEDAGREASKETAGEKEVAPEGAIGREEALALKSVSTTETQSEGTAEKEQKWAAEGLQLGLVSSPVEPASPMPEASGEAPTTMTEPAESLATPVEKDSAPVLELGSPIPPTPGPRLIRSVSKAGEGSRTNGGSSAFGSPVPTAPESALRGNPSSALASPGRVLRSASKSPGSPFAAQIAETPAPSTLDLSSSALNPASSALNPALSSPGGPTRAASNAQVTPGSLSWAAEERLPAVAPSPADELPDRVTRSGSRARKEIGETSPPAIVSAQNSTGKAELSPVSPVQDVVSHSSISPAPKSSDAGNGVPSTSADVDSGEASQPPLSPPGRVTRSASQARTTPKQTDTPVSSGADIAPESGSRKRSRGEGDVSEQPTPDGLARVSGEKGTPGVLTRSQSKQRGSADVTPGWNGSPEILEGDLSGVLVSPKSPSTTEAAKPQSGSMPSQNLPKRSLEASPNPAGKFETKSKTRKPEASPLESARASVEDKKEPAAGKHGPMSPGHDASPSVDMDVCTTPLTAGPRKALRLLTGKRNAQGKRKESAGLVGSEGAGVTSAGKADDVRSPIRRSPRFQGERMTSANGVTSAAKQSLPLGGGSSVRKSERLQERSAKKMRLSGGFALAGLGGGLIDLENEDEDLMEPNFETNSEGLRRSARKTAGGAKESPGGDGKNRLSFSEAAGLSADVGNFSPVAKAPESGVKSFRFSARKSVRKSARKRSAGGRASFVCASDDGSGEFAAAGFGGLAAEASAGNLDGFAAGSKSTQKKTPAKRGNLIANGITSLLSFMTKKEPAGPPIPGNNKNTVKVSCLRLG